MKRGNDEEKVVGPLFPRLHVNDTERGGPRAPPRNKMALYEQLTIPSQRFSSVASVRSRPSRSTSSTLVPSASSSQGGCRISSACYISSTALSHLANFYNSNSSNSLNVKDANEDANQAENNMNYKSSNAMGILYSVESEAKKAQHLENNTNDKSSDAVGISYSVEFNVKEPHWKETPEEDDFRVPTFVQSKLALTSSQCQCIVNQTITQASPPKELAVIDKIVQTMKTTSNSSSQNQKSSKNNTQLNTSKDAILTEQRAKDHTDPCSKEEHLNNPVKMSEHQSSGNNTYNTSLPLEKQIIEHDSRAQTESDVQTLLSKNIDDVHRSHWSSQEGDNNSETSMVDSISEADISPDDVVEIIGHKNFWKARRLILNQQRVFALQVFELHRIWKVQKLIAAFPPQSLFPDEPYSEVHTNKSSPEMCFKSQEQIIKANQVATHPKQDMEKKPNSSCLTQNMGKPFSYIPKYASPVISNTKSNPWLLTPNQFLVPFISPSEGFFYKSCTGPHPPHQSYMAAMDQKRMKVVSTLNSQKSINSSNRNSEGFSCYVRNNLTSRDSDIQGSTEDSHGQRSQGTKGGNVSEGKEILHLFPTTSNVKDHGQTSESLTCKDNVSRVIKVVPYNSFSATESAARIFQSIQEEKRQHHRS